MHIVFSLLCFNSSTTNDQKIDKLKDIENEMTSIKLSKENHKKEYEKKSRTAFDLGVQVSQLKKKLKKFEDDLKIKEEVLKITHPANTIIIETVNRSINFLKKDISTVKEDIAKKEVRINKINEDMKQIRNLEKECQNEIQNLTQKKHYLKQQIATDLNKK